jgi:hypothetical protein
MAPGTVVLERIFEVLMLRRSPLVLLIASALLSLSCADSTVVQTGSIEVEWDQDQLETFEAAQTFGVVTADLVDPPDLDDEQMAFKDKVNQLIITAMQQEPVCLTLIAPDEVTDETFGRRTDSRGPPTVATTTGASLAGGGAIGAGTGIPVRTGVRLTSSGTWAAS